MSKVVYSKYTGDDMAIKEFVKKNKKDETNDGQENQISDATLNFINKGGGSTQEEKPLELKKVSIRANNNSLYQRLTIRVPKKLLIKIEKKVKSLDYPLSINQWIIKQLLKLVDD